MNVIKIKQVADGTKIVKYEIRLETLSVNQNGF